MQLIEAIYVLLSLCIILLILSVLYLDQKKINNTNTNIFLELITVRFKLDIKKISLFLETTNPILKYRKATIPVQNIKVYKRHGGGENVFGVSFANLNLLAKKIKTDLIIQELESNKVPVIVPMGKGKDNKNYNINADHAALEIAKKMNARRLLLMTDVEGVLDENQKLISEINLNRANEMLKNNIISGGMIPKINTCLDAISNGVRGVVIVDGRKPHSILFELFSDKGAGTLIRK